MAALTTGKSSATPETITIELDGQSQPVRLKRRTGAKRLTLRIDPMSGLPQITLPPALDKSEAERFARQQQGWIAKQLAKRPDAILIEDGASVPLRGALVPVKLTDRPPRTVFEADGYLVIGGPQDMAADRLTKYLKTEAKQHLTQAVAHYADKLGKHPSKIVIRDTVSRWGSCSSARVISLSWRLILAPDDVLGYVAAHEVAHLAEMNHDPAFWRVVDRLCPDWAQSRAWLKREGASLLATRFEPASLSA